MWEEVGVCTPVACWRRVGGGNSPCNAPALARASVWSLKSLSCPG